MHNKVRPIVVVAGPRQLDSTAWKFNDVSYWLRTNGLSAEQLNDAWSFAVQKALVVILCDAMGLPFYKLHALHV